MNKTMIALLALSIALTTSIAEERPDIQETISGRSFRAIQAAIPELERFTPDVSDYVITVAREGSELVVQFLNPKDTKPEGRGCLGPKPCVAVWVRPDDFRVLYSQLEK